MATTRNYLDFACTQLEGIWGIDYKRMFGEYQIYVNDKPVLLVCDNTVFVKNHPALAQLLAEAPEGLPYPGAKPGRKFWTVENRALTRRRSWKFWERVTPVSKRRVQKTYGAL